MTSGGRNFNDFPGLKIFVDTEVKKYSFHIISYSF